MLRLYTLCFLFLTFTSCSSFFEQEIDNYDLPFTEQLVLYALLIPQDSLAYAEVNLLSPADGEPSEFDAAEATVILEVNGLTFPFTYESAQNRFIIDITELSLETNTSFNVVATWSNLRAAGSAIIPDQVPEREQLVGNFTVTESDNSVRIGLTEPSLTVDGYALIHDQLNWRDGEISRRVRSLVDFLPAPPPATDTLFFKELTFNRTTVADEPVNQAFVCYASADFLELQRSRVQYGSSAENPFSEVTNIASNLSEGFGNVSGLNCLRVTF